MPSNWSPSEKAQQMSKSPEVQFCVAAILPRKNTSLQCEEGSLFGFLEKRKTDHLKISKPAHSILQNNR